ncbi:hypothetical protein IDM40_09185 [Nocardiopsis sp. HNM0947]|uniref:Uncharacterized protein n=1 Tax=Nocardiopsis coralli TaxID=2772213 RepID=A0ABR9P4X6_9ACTN|nr:hypothetical protein [Nocardiopsis coralli]MBE2998877.1 hypothetical protein [Nocardiopsis coralli]
MPRPNSEDADHVRVLTRKEAARDLIVCLKTRGMRFELDVPRLLITAKLDHAAQAVVLRGVAADARWCMVWEAEGSGGGPGWDSAEAPGEDPGPTIEPVLPIGQEWELSRRLLAILELGRLKL